MEPGGGGGGGNRFIALVPSGGSVPPGGGGGGGNKFIALVPSGGSVPPGGGGGGGNKFIALVPSGGSVPPGGGGGGGNKFIALVPSGGSVPPGGGGGGSSKFVAVAALNVFGALWCDSFASETKKPVKWVLPVMVPTREGEAGVTAGVVAETPSKAPQSPRNIANEINFDIIKWPSFHRLAETRTTWD